MAGEENKPEPNTPEPIIASQNGQMTLAMETVQRDGVQGAIVLIVADDGMLQVSAASSGNEEVMRVIHEAGTALKEWMAKRFPNGNPRKHTGVFSDEEGN